MGPPCSARIEEPEISRTVHGDVSIRRLQRSSFSRITLSPTRGHTFFLIRPGKNTISTWQCFRCHSWHNPFWPEYLTEAGNPKVASLKVRRVGRTAARSSCATNSVTRRSRDRRIGGKLRSARQAGAARFEADAPSAPYVARLRRQWPLPRFAPTASRSAGAASRTSAPRRHTTRHAPSERKETHRHARPLHPLREQRAARISRASILPLPFASQSHH